MASGRDSLRLRILGLMDRLFLDMRPLASDSWLLMDLTMVQLRTLFLLCTLGPLRMSEIASRLGVGMPAASSVVSKLEEKGLALREHNLEDRRGVSCSATKEGQRRVELLWQVRRERVEQIAHALSDQELELVSLALEAILRAKSESQAGSQSLSQVVGTYPEE